MKGETKVKFEIEVAASSIMSQVVLNNKDIEAKIQEGVKKAIDNFDIVGEVEKQTTEVLRHAIRNQVSTYKIQTKVEESVAKLISNKVSAILAKLGLEE